MSSNAEYMKRLFESEKCKLPDLDTLDKIKVVEWFAMMMLIIKEEHDYTQEGDYGGKSYDPMTIELNRGGGGIAHSYVFDMEDGGRHHLFENLEDIPRILVTEVLECITETICSAN
jgi:hypothetical protein